MTDRAGRLLALLDALRGSLRPVRGAELAGRLEVSLRTVYRDIASLRAQGAGIDGDPGVGYRLQPGYLLPSLMFSADELEALALGARWVAHQTDPELAAAAEQAINRITSTLPAQLRVTVETSGLFAPPWAAASPREPWLPALRQAIRDEHAVRVVYRDARERPSMRILWPFAMAFYDQVRLLAAWCELRKDFRHFRADRVLDLTDTGARYPSRRHLLLKCWHKQTGLGERRRVEAADGNCQQW